jgi:hypothetical protein
LNKPFLSGRNAKKCTIRPSYSASGSGGKPTSRAQRERKAKACWDSLTEAQDWALLRMRYFEVGQRASATHRALMAGTGSRNRTRVSFRSLWIMLAIVAGHTDPSARQAASPASTPAPSPQLGGNPLAAIDVRGGTPTISAERGEEKETRTRLRPRTAGGNSLGGRWFGHTREAVLPDSERPRPIKQIGSPCIIELDTL